jgi:hypothetical protein
MKLYLDVQKSMELAPPKYSKGIKFKKRVVLKRGKDGVVTYPPTNNPREDHVHWSQVPLIKDSFVVNGFIHEVAPPTVKIDPNNPDRFIGLTGYHREAAAQQLDLDTMMYDVLEFDSPLSERTHRITSNHHRLPSLTNTEADVIKQVKEAIKNEEITNDDIEIKKLIDIFADDKTERVRNNIFKNFRKHVLTPGATIRNYHTDGGEFSTEEFANKYGIPTGGDKSYSKTKRLGYQTGIVTPKTTLFDGKKLSMAYGGQEVEIYGWIQNGPKEAPAIYGQREQFSEKFEEFIRDDCEFTQSWLEKCGIKVKLDELIKNHPIKLKGFLAQDISSDPFNGGKPKEDGVVNINGNKV